LATVFMPSTLLVTGASGFLGSHLAQALVNDGRRVRAMTRKPDGYDGAGTPVVDDVTDPDSLRKAMEGIDVAYHRVHALDSVDFEHKDAEAAEQFGRAAFESGVDRIVYLGGRTRNPKRLPLRCPQVRAHATREGGRSAAELDARGSVHGAGEARETDGLNGLDSTDRGAAGPGGGRRRHSTDKHAFGVPTRSARTRSQWIGSVGTGTHCHDGDGMWPERAMPTTSGRFRLYRGGCFLRSRGLSPMTTCRRSWGLLRMLSFPRKAAPE
jgi:hypothetical protein